MSFWKAASCQVSQHLKVERTESMRTPILAGNWKMHCTIAEAQALAVGVAEGVKGLEGREVILAPTFTALATVRDAVAGTNVLLSAQNVYWENSGAFTGEISPAMLRDAGCSHVIIGHSERRQSFGETDYTVAKKIAAAHEHGLIPIFCVGESLEQREAGQTLEWIDKQVRHGLVELPEDGMASLVVAYEPVWAIGTGKVATTEQAEEVHAHIRAVLGSFMPNGLADRVRILYGGSVKPENVDELMACPNIDGALVGGAALKPESFVRIARYEEK
ncbi:MAG: triosephosphate isomerase [Hyphomicrobiaceae bacterium]